MSPGFQSRITDLCPSYRKFLAEHDTESMIGDVIVLYGQDSIEERNSTNEVAEYLPDYVSIGNDSGDYEFLLKRDGSEAVIWEDQGSFAAPSLQAIHASFPQWLVEGCPLLEEPESPIPLRGRIWLLAAPPGGMKDLFALNKLLTLNWPIPKLKHCLEGFPALLVDDGQPFRVHRILAEDTALRPLLGFSAPSSDEIHPYTGFDLIDGMPLSSP